MDLGRDVMDRPFVIERKIQDTASGFRHRSYSVSSQESTQTTHRRLRKTTIEEEEEKNEKRGKRYFQWCVYL